MVLGIITTKVTDPSGPRLLYRARGDGSDYQDFYRWLGKRARTREWDDMPWHGWQFTDPADDAAIVVHWGRYFLSPDPDEHYDEIEPLPEPATPEQIQLAADLQQAINEEIMAEIFASIKRLD